MTLKHKDLATLHQAHSITGTIQTRGQTHICKEHGLSLLRKCLPNADLSISAITRKEQQADEPPRLLRLCSCGRQRSLGVWNAGHIAASLHARSVYARSLSLTTCHSVPWSLF